MTAQVFWVVDQHQELTPGVRAWLLSHYAYAAPAEHTYAALVSLRAEGSLGVTCLVTFPYSFVLAGALAGDLEAAIDSACRARLLAMRNAEPLTTIVERRHAL